MKLLSRVMARTSQLRPVSKAQPLVPSHLHFPSLEHRNLCSPGFVMVRPVSSLLSKAPPASAAALSTCVMLEEAENRFIPRG